MASTIILHGYSDTYTSFRPLRDFLGAQGFAVTDILLANYVSMEDNLTIQDLAKAFAAALAAQKVEEPFNLIVHSTGALVAREWLARFYLEAGKACPLTRLLMLAPANFGSPLAGLGKTMFGRVIKGWESNFQTGTHILDALEMGSAYSWALAQRDLFGGRSFFRPEVCLTAVFVGTQPYNAGFRQLVDKPGTDGTVYVCTANLNATCVRARFKEDGQAPEVEQIASAAAPIAFRVFNDRDHGSITRPDQGPASLGKEIVQFLRVEQAGYAAFSAYCQGEVAATFQNPRDENTHQYENLVAHVSDDLGMAVDDYFMEFYEAPLKGEVDDPEAAPDALMVDMHTQIMEAVHPYQKDKSYRSLIFDITDLDAKLQGRTLALSLSAAGHGQYITYAGTTLTNIGEIELKAGSATMAQFRRPNETLLLDVRLERVAERSVMGFPPLA